MDEDRLRKRLMPTFLCELEEHVHTLNRDLRALEEAPGGPGQAERFKSLFRAAHSLKGAAHSINIEPIEEACHRIEEVLIAAQDSQAPLSPDQFALLFTTVDAMEQAGMRLREQ